MPNIIRIASLFCLSLLLSSCGFALRGSERPALPPGSDTVFLRSAQENSPLSQSVQTALQAQQLRLVADASEAAYVLQIGPEEFDSQAATVNGRATAAQYRYLLSAEVSLSQNGVTLLEPERIIVENQLFFDSYNTAGSLQEEDLVRQEMRQQFAQQLLSRLRALAAAQ
ncbi:MAG: hypothetical protein H7A05_01500 [Pseudomonadales bacterium]|nr:hypothetical protein [Pseudomonadales bacterium]MCP5330893.1 hypothetical protein [Pseudomonadales bacterium]MCP5343273.1 hypothetical protein [Pseudomonadales bacterium]